MDGECAVCPPGYECRGGADVWALAETLAVLDEARGLRPDLLARIVCNRVDSRTAFSRALRAAVAELPVATLKASLGQRVAYAEALTAGEGVATYAPGSAAAKEARALAREVLQAMGA